MLRSAVERQLFIVGEAFAQLARWDPELADSFEEKARIIGFRNQLAHGYSILEHEQVYAIAVTDLPLLLAKVEALLAG